MSTYRKYHIMLKRILLSIVLLLITVYLGVAVTVFNRKPADQVCRDVELIIKDTVYAGFVTKDEVTGILQKKGIYPVGKKMERIHTKTLETSWTSIRLSMRQSAIRPPVASFAWRSDSVSRSSVS